MSPVSGYLSPYDVILSLDEFRVNTAEEWKQKIAVLANQTPLLSFGQSNEIEHVQKSYCVPRSLIQKSIQVPLTGDETYCPNELFAFAPITCPDTSKFDDGGNKTNHQNTGGSIHCLNAKDVIKLKKCAYDTVQVSKNNTGCLCSEVVYPSPWNPSNLLAIISFYLEMVYDTCENRMNHAWCQSNFLV